VQLYRYFVSQSGEFCRHNHLCCFSTWVYCCCCCCLFRYRLSPETFGYTLVYCSETPVQTTAKKTVNLTGIFMTFMGRLCEYALESGSIAPRILNLVTRWMSGKVHDPLPLSPEKDPSVPNVLESGWVLEPIWKCCSCWESSPCRPARSLVTILTELLQYENELLVLKFLIFDIDSHPCVRYFIVRRYCESGKQGVPPLPDTFPA
jgi:hypothetical protein